MNQTSRRKIFSNFKQNYKYLIFRMIFGTIKHFVTRWWKVHHYSARRQLANVLRQGLIVFAEDDRFTTSGRFRTRRASFKQTQPASLQLVTVPRDGSIIGGLYLHKTEAR